MAEGELVEEVEEEVSPSPRYQIANKEKGGTYHVTRSHYPREFCVQSPAV